MTPIELNPHLIVHYGIPSTASHLAYDPIQQLLAVGTQDGRIKIIGGDNIEGLFTSPKELSFKNLEFLQNQGFLISVSHENEVQVWDLEHRCVASALQWNVNITAFAVIQETSCMYIGDESGLVSVLKYDVKERMLLQLPYSISAHSVSEAAGAVFPKHQSVVGILPQPCSRGNRLLFAYDSGIFVLWDVSKDNILLIRGCNDGSGENSANARSSEPKDQTSGDEQEDKEITSLCWASLDGSILAVGYVDGDIMLWHLPEGATANRNKTGKPVDNLVKLQLSSADSRFPVIYLRWSAGDIHNNNGGQLFVYGGDEIGSAEVLTILSLEWSPQREALENVRRENITLQGSFTDMILLHSYSVLENEEAPSLFILSSPGQLQFYDSSCLSRLNSHQDETCAIPTHYRSAVPTTEPYLTAGRLISVHGNTKCSVAISKMASAAKSQGTHISNEKSSKWPLNGGVPCQLPAPEERNIESLYIAGYQDGSVRIWDATYPMVSPLCLLDPEVRGVSVAGATASVSALDFSSETLHIAIGSDSGTVRLCNLSGNCSETRVHVVTGTKHEVYDMDQGNGSLLSAVFILVTSPVSTLRYTNLGTRLAVGYESGQVAVVNINLPSIVFLLDALPSPSSPVISFTSVMFSDTYGLTTSLDHSEPKGQSECAKELIFSLRSDLLVDVLDVSSGNLVSSLPINRNKESTAISMYILDGTKCVTEVAGGKYMQFFSPEDRAVVEPGQLSSHCEGDSEGVARSTNFIQSSEDLSILICCTDALQLYSLQSAIQGHLDTVHEANLLKTSCWTAPFKKNANDFGLIVLYETGSVEFRGLPNLEVLNELSLLSMLRWNFKTNMGRTTSSTENGQIALVNGSEFAIVSLLAHENDFRLPQSLPCLHNKLLAAALDLNSDQNKDKKEPLGIFGGAMGASGAGKESHSIDPAETSMDSKITDDVVELDIDDIDIDGPLRVSPILHKSENEIKDKKPERKKLFEGGTSEAKPRQRTVEEIKAKYRMDNSAATSAAAAASQAKDKLLERQEKLERLSKNTEELRDGAENFASMAKELAKRMENRKWWQL